MTLGAGLMVVTARNLVHSALWLVVALFGVAVMYVLLQAGFLAVVQVVIYIGAIAILIIFAHHADPQDCPGQRPALQRKLGLGAGHRRGDLRAGWSGCSSTWSGFQTLAAAAEPSASIRCVSLALALVSPDAYVLPFELASVLLLAALIGAMVVAWERK